MPSDTLATVIDGLFLPYNRSDSPGAVAAVRHRGKVVYRQAFGLANIEHAVPNQPGTRMRIGSTTKQMCCLCILLLEEANVLDSRKPVSAYLPEWDSHASGEPTLLQLMQHSSGVPDPLGAAWLMTGANFNQMPVDASLQILRRLTNRNFLPGTRFAYSNAGYTLLSKVIERVSGMSLQAFMADEVFKPLGMTDTVLLPSDLDILPGMASPCLPQPDGTWRRGIHPEDLLGAGGVVSTVDDMLRWLDHLRRPEKRVGSARTWQRILQNGHFINETPHPYGMGVICETLGGVDIIHHAGATLGGQCQALTAPAHELDIVVMTNRMDGPAPTLALKILESVLDQAIATPTHNLANPDDHPALLGRWFSHQSHTLIELSSQSIDNASESALALSIYNTPAGNLIKGASGLAKPAGPSSSLEIRELPAHDTAPDYLDIHICGEPERFVRLPDTPPEPEQLARDLCGHYRYLDMDKEVCIRWHEDKLVMDLQPWCGTAHWELTPYSDEVLGCGKFCSSPAFALPQPAQITLDRSGGKVSGFWWSADRSRNVRFERC